MGFFDMFRGGNVPPEAMGVRPENREPREADIALADEQPAWHAFLDLSDGELPLVLKPEKEQAAREAFRDFAMRHPDELAGLSGLSLQEAQARVMGVEHTDAQHAAENAA